MQGGHVGCKGIFGWSAGRPPQVGESDHAVTGPDQCRNILWGMSRGFNQADRRRDIEAFGGSAVPYIVLVNSPVIMKAGVWEQCRVDSMVRVVMGKYDIGDGRGRLTQCRKWLENCARTGHHTGIDNYADVTIADVGDRRGYMPAYVAIEENMHLCRRGKRFIAICYHLCLSQISSSNKHCSC